MPNGPVEGWFSREGGWWVEKRMGKVVGGQFGEVTGRQLRRKGEWGWKMGRNVRRGGDSDIYPNQLGS